MPGYTIKAGVNPLTGAADQGTLKYFYIMKDGVICGGSPTWEQCHDWINFMYELNAQVEGTITDLRQLMDALSLSPGQRDCLGAAMDTLTRLPDIDKALKWPGDAKMDEAGYPKPDFTWTAQMDTRERHGGGNHDKKMD